MRFNARTTVAFRNLIFGVEDGLVSTVGLLSGIAIAGVPRSTILLTGVVLIFVEAVSMAAGSFLSEASAEDLTRRNEDTRPIVAGSVMFLSYFIAGFIPLAPYVFVPTSDAFGFSIVASLLALFVLGFWSGSLSRTRRFRSALRMSIVGGLAVAVGVAAGALIGQ